MPRVSILCLALISSRASAINFPGVSESAASRLVFGRNTFTTAACTGAGVTLNTIVLSPGEGRVFQVMMMMMTLMMMMILADGGQDKDVAVEEYSSDQEEKAKHLRWSQKT